MNLAIRRSFLPASRTDSTAREQIGSAVVAEGIDHGDAAGQEGAELFGDELLVEAGRELQGSSGGGGYTAWRGASWRESRREIR